MKLWCLWGLWIGKEFKRIELGCWYFAQDVNHLHQGDEETP